MKKLTKLDLRRIISEEIRKIMDEDAIFIHRTDPGHNMKKSPCGCGTCKKCSDSHDEPEDHDHHEFYMADKNAWKISNYGKELDQMIEPGEQIPDWMNSKLSRIATDIGDVKHALEYDHYKKR